MSQPFVMAPPEPVALFTTDGRRFAARRIFAVARNYAEHAREMGGGGEAPFFFMKPADTLLAARAAGETLALPYPPLSSNVHHEVELLLALSAGGRNLSRAEAAACIAGYAVGLDMTRRDLQAEAKAAGRPWEIGKVFEGAAPVGRLTLRSDVMASGAITLDVNGERRQTGDLSQMVADVPAIIEALSQAWTLAPGDLIFTGTPAGVGAVQVGDVLEARIEGLEALTLRMAPASA